MHSWIRTPPRHNTGGGYKCESLYLLHCHYVQLLPGRKLLLLVPLCFLFLSCILFKWKAAKLTRRRVVSPCNLGAFPDLWVGFFFFLFFLRSSPKSNSFSDTSKAPCRVTGEWVCVCVCAVYLLRRMCAAPLLSGGFFSSLTEGAQESLHLDFSKALF